MRSVVQRVNGASVCVGGTRIANIGKGLLAYLGITKGDREDDAEYLADKIYNLRIFEDLEGKMNLSLRAVQGEILVVSQFTLVADCRRGRRPSFTEAEDPQHALVLYDYFIKVLQRKNGSVAQGVFQSVMAVESINDGPITMLLDSRRCF